jgi:hypothetical protein
MKRDLQKSIIPYYATWDSVREFVRIPKKQKWGLIGALAGTFPPSFNYFLCVPFFFGKGNWKGSSCFIQFVKCIDSASLSLLSIAKPLDPKDDSRGSIITNGPMEKYLRQLADESAICFSATTATASTRSGAPSSYTDDRIMFSAAIDGGDDDEHDELHSETTDSIASFAEWFFSDNSDHREENHLRGCRKCGCDVVGAASPTDTGNCCSVANECGNDSRRMQQLNAPQYREFLQCAKSSIDIVSYVLDPLGDICRGTKFCISTWNDDRTYHPIVHRNQTKKNHHYHEMNYFSEEPSVESQNECRTISTTTSSRNCSVDKTTLSFSPRGVDMTTTGCTIDKAVGSTDNLDDGRLGIAPMIQYSHLTHNDHDGTIARKLFVSDEDDFAISFGTNVYRENCHGQQYATNLTQMLIETSHLLSLTEDASHILSSANDHGRPTIGRTNDEACTSPSPDPHAIYCCHPRQRMHLEEKKSRKTTPSLSDPYAIYCCQPRARIRHENAHDKIKQNDNNAITITDNNDERVQPIASTSIATAKLSTVPSATTTIATSTSFTMTAGWSGDKLKKAKMKRRAKLLKAKLDAS